jgi:hypothetical protein
MSSSVEANASAASAPRIVFQRTPAARSSKREMENRKCGVPLLLGGKAERFESFEGFDHSHRRREGTFAFWAVDQNDAGAAAFAEHCIAPETFEHGSSGNGMTTIRAFGKFAHHGTREFLHQLPEGRQMFDENFTKYFLALDMTNLPTGTHGY